MGKTSVIRVANWVFVSVSVVLEIVVSKIYEKPNLQTVLSPSDRDQNTKMHLPPKNTEDFIFL